MGTNFYWINKVDPEDGDSPRDHIGKRSAAGEYCFTCGISLCKDGASSVHKGREQWWDECPCCGSKMEKEGLATSSAGIELGFASPRDRKQDVGVHSCSSFTWTMMVHKRWIEGKYNYDIKIIVDEYGVEYTAKEFLDMVEANCQIQFQYYGCFS